MRLVNQTAVPAVLTTSDLDGSSRRVGVLTAKASFRFDHRGQVELETQEPLPLFAQDQRTALGDLPGDLQPRADTAFEVILLGHAYAPDERPVSGLTVRLTVGDVRRELLVFGDRTWAPNRKACSRPTPFTEMPLGYERAFGGTVPISLDRESIFDLSDSCNKHGKGFDAERKARELGGLLRAPSGYPKLPGGYVRPLPNLEDPAAPIARWEDAPRPMSWATVPADVPIWATRPISHAAPAESHELPAAIGYRAHPDWVIPLPSAAPRLRLENLLPSTPVLEMSVPDLKVVADYTLGGRMGSRPLLPHTLVLLPDQARFTMVYRLPFNFQFATGDDRELRLRVESKWFGGQA